MNICFICKYPPIQGGVSMHGYWAARGLAERGHQVFVVTNANEIEETFRIRISPADLAEGGEYARSFPETGGRVEVHSTEAPDRSKLYYIPMGNPTVTRLATMATDIIRRHDCKVIFSYYLEPYGMAAHLASAWTGVPYVFKHAGSDLNRLLPLDDLKTAYLEVLGRANRIISRGPSRRQLLSLGLDEERLDSRVAFGLPEHYFRPEGPRMDINAFLAELSETQTEEERAAGRYAPIDDRLPTIGIYGKLGVYKGTFDLVNAMARVVRSGKPFNLVAVSHGWQEKAFWRYVAEAGIGQYIRMLPFIPHWNIPSFIRACTAVTFLERDFPIASHTPTIPSEIIQTGCCALVSEEVIRKQMFRLQVRDRQNLIVVPDPKDHDALAARLRFAVESPERAAQIGRRGFEDLGGGHGYKAYVDGLESLLTEVSAEAPATRSLGSAPAPRKEPTPLELVGALFPSTYGALRPELRPAVEAAVSPVDRTSGERAAIAGRVGGALESALAEAAPGEPSAPLELCRYERKLHAWSGMSSTSGEKRATREVRFTATELASLAPVIRGEWEIAGFACDVEAIVSALERKEQVSVSREGVKIFFRRGSMPLRLNEATETLIRLVDETAGTETTESLFDLLAQIFEVPAEGRAHLSSSCLSVLEGLYWEGFLDFEPTPGRDQQTAA